MSDRHLGDDIPPGFPSDHHSALQAAEDAVWEILSGGAPHDQILSIEVAAAAVRAWLDSVELAPRWCEAQEVEYTERYRKTRNGHDRMSAERFAVLSQAIRAVQP